MTRVSKTSHPKFPTMGATRATNHGINPAMPSNRVAAHGLDWATGGPKHDTTVTKKATVDQSAAFEEVHGDWYPNKT